MHMVLKSALWTTAKPMKTMDWHHSKHDFLYPKHSSTNRTQYKKSNSGLHPSVPSYLEPKFFDLMYFSVWCTLGWSPLELSQTSPIVIFIVHTMGKCPQGLRSAIKRQDIPSKQDHHWQWDTTVQWARKWIAPSAKGSFCKTTDQWQWDAAWQH